MDFIRKNSSALLVCLFELLIGILLLIDPVGFTSGIIIAAGVVMILAGLFCIIRYFRLEAGEAVVRQTLLKGLVLLLAGLFCACNSRWFITTFSLLTVLYGLVILLSGLGKVQWTLDLVRLGRGRWPLVALSAAVSILCGLVILCNPFTSTTILWMFAGISLIVEAVFNMVVLLLGNRN